MSARSGPLFLLGAPMTPSTRNGAVWRTQHGGPVLRHSPGAGSHTVAGVDRRVRTQATTAAGMLAAVRAVNDVERAVLKRLLAVDFDGVEALRAQANAVVEVELNCTCGCPSITPTLDRSAAPPAHCSSPLPAELVELNRTDGIPRSVLCFLDDDGYLGNLECVYYDDAAAEWPEPRNCAVLVRDDLRYLQAVGLPSGTVVHPHELGDRWVSFEEQSDGGFCASTWSGYRECFGPDGALRSRDFTK